MKNKSLAIDTLLFDLDGTLLDTAPDLAFAVNQVLASHGKPAIELEAFRFLVHGGSRTIIEGTFHINPDHPNFSKIKQAFFQSYYDNIAKQTQLFPGVAEVLNYLDQNQITWGIVTNKPMWLTEPLLKHFKLYDRAQCIVGGDSLAQAKPHPAPLLHACQLIQKSPQHCVYIGDTELDMIAAKAAGMRTIAALYGYKSKTCIPQNWNADCLITSPLEILDWLNQHGIGIQKEIKDEPC